MNILQINKFLYPKGGDAISMLNTGRLLAQRGHTVHYWGMRHPANPDYPHADLFVDEINYHGRLSARQLARQSLNLLYSMEAKRKVERLVLKIKPDLVHLHNFAHQLSPSILDVFRKHRLPVVMTLHDYILVCPVYTLLSPAGICRRCQGGRYYWCTLKKCAKGSYAKSFLSTLEMVLHHQVLRLYNQVDLYLSPSRFLQETVSQMGFKGEVRCLPNFLDLSQFPEPAAVSEPSFVYFGRLSAEKGLKTLITAMAGIQAPLKLIGDGPQRAELETWAREQAPGRVHFLGYLQGEALRREVQRSLAVVQPSEWYENNPLSVLEAFALGKPVIGSNLGGIPELVQDGVTGLIFEAGNAGQLRERLAWFHEHAPQAKTMGAAARERIAGAYNPDQHYEALMGFYQEAIRKHPKRA